MEGLLIGRIQIAAYLGLSMRQLVSRIPELRQSGCIFHVRRPVAGNKHHTRPAVAAHTHNLDRWANAKLQQGQCI